MGAASDGSQNSQQLVVHCYKARWVNLRTTAETGGGFTVSYECEGPAVKTKRAPCCKESARNRITCYISYVKNIKFL